MALTYKQRVERQKGIGGSDVGPICGVSPFKDATAYRVYLQKTEPVDPAEEDDFDESRPWLTWGNYLEPVVRQHWCDLNERKMVKPKRQIIHPQFDWMRANLDGISFHGDSWDDRDVAEDRGYEGKIYRTSEGWGDNGSDEIPDYVMLQVQHYMMVTGLTVFDVSVLIGNSDFRSYIIHSDATIQRHLFHIEDQFWNEHVVPRIPPPIETLEDARKRWGSVLHRKLRDAEAVEVAAWRKLRDVKDQLKQLTDQEEELKLLLQKAIGSHEGLMHEGVPLVTWKQTKDKESVDWKAIYREHPEIVNAYKKLSPGPRMFLVKKPPKPKPKKRAKK